MQLPPKHIPLKLIKDTDASGAIGVSEWYYYYYWTCKKYTYFSPFTGKKIITNSKPVRQPSANNRQSTVCAFFWLHFGGWGLFIANI